MNEKTDFKTIDSLQKDSDYIVLNNPLASPKFIRMIGKDKEMTINDTYTPKIFYEIVSRLTPEDLRDVKENQNIKIDININQFLKDIGANSKNYKHLILSVEALQTVLFKWKEDGAEHRSSIITYSIHDPKSGKIQIQIHEKMVRHILEVKQKENFSFLKSNIFRLQNAQAIRLYPFFEKWLNVGKYVTDLERFKNDFGYNSSGYRFYTNLEKKVLIPAIEEINEKTNLLVNYKPTGDNLESERPRIKGLIFVIKPKHKSLKLTGQKGIIALEEQTKQNEITTLRVIFSSLKFEITARLSKETAEAALINWVEKYGYDAVYNGLMQAKDTHKQEIRNPIGFFGGDYFQNHKNYLKHKQQAQQNQEREKEEKALNAKKLKLIIEDFRKREMEYFIKILNELSQEERLQKIEPIKHKIEYFKDNQLTKMGIYILGKSMAEAMGYNAQKTIQNLAKRDYDTTLSFDKDGRALIQETGFETQTKLV